MFHQVFTFKCSSISSDCLHVIRPGYANAMGPIFSHNKGNCVRFTKLLFCRFIHCAVVIPFYPLLVSFRLQIAYRKVGNLQISDNKLVEKVSINLLYLVKSVICIIRIIIDVPAIAYTVVIRSLCRTPKQIDLTAFSLLHLPYCVSV